MYLIMLYLQTSSKEWNKKIDGMVGTTQLYKFNLKRLLKIIEFFFILKFVIQYKIYSYAFINKSRLINTGLFVYVFTNIKYFNKE